MKRRVIFGVGGGMLIMILVAMSLLSGCVDNSAILSFQLGQNAPSILNENVLVGMRYSLSRENSVTLSIHNVAGGLVRMFVDDEVQDANVDHQYTWDLRDALGNRVAIGTYYARLSVPNATRLLTIYVFR